MAHAIMFDTLYYANKLKTAGVPSAQAEVQAETLAEIIHETEGHIATKSDIEKMNLQFLNLKSEIELKLSDTKNELIKWVIGMAFGQTAIVFTLIKFFN